MLGLGRKHMFEVFSDVSVLADKETDPHTPKLSIGLADHRGMFLLPCLNSCDVVTGHFQTEIATFEEIVNVFIPLFRGLLSVRSPLFICGHPHWRECQDRHFLQIPSALKDGKPKIVQRRNPTWQMPPQGYTISHTVLSDVVQGQVHALNLAQTWTQSAFWLKHMLTRGSTQNAPNV